MLFDAHLTIQSTDSSGFLPTRGKCDLLGVAMVVFLLGMVSCSLTNFTADDEVHHKKCVVSLTKFIITHEQSFADSCSSDLKLAHYIIRFVYNSTTPRTTCRNTSTP